VPVATTNGHAVTPALGTSELLRVATAGSVDDGKSTLIGRLLLDSKQILEDQLAAVERTTLEQGGAEGLNLALLTDGLRAERERGITIDVAYRYFATPRRRFVLADTPGHVEYTRNMVTGASRSDVSIVLVDARAGVVEQSRRHASISALLRIPHVVLCVNKMDLVGFDRAVFERVAEEFTGLATRLGVEDVTAIPISALLGDNVVEPSPSMPWFTGSPLLRHLEDIELIPEGRTSGARLPVQWVLPAAGSPDERCYAGQVSGGVLRPGDDVRVLPSGESGRITRIETFDGELDEAAAPRAVTVHLTGGLHAVRGDMIVAAAEPPALTTELEATLCWMSEEPLVPGDGLLLKHATRTVRARVGELRFRLDNDSLEHEPAPPRLTLNDLAGVRIAVDEPLALDPYRDNRVTGSFILIDEATNATVAGGMVDAALAVGG